MVRFKLGMATVMVLLVAAAGTGSWWASELDAGEGTHSADQRDPGAVASAGAVRPVALSAAPARPRPKALPRVARFAVASFNLLGSSHTEPGGHHAHLASGPQRLPGAMAILAGHDVSVAGFQEFQPDQRAAFERDVKGWAMFPGLAMKGRGGENSVAWRTSTWDLIESDTVPIPYFNGRIREMPFVLLRHRATGLRAYFSTFHNPADTRAFPNQQRFRNEATDRQVALFKKLEATGIPQFVTGDMNERDEYFCRVTGATGLVAAAGGGNNGRCAPPKRAPIDWIFGSGQAQFTDYTVDRSPLARRTTDHPVSIASVAVDAQRFARASRARVSAGR